MQFSQWFLNYSVQKKPTEKKLANQNYTLASVKYSLSITALKYDAQISIEPSLAQCTSETEKKTFTPAQLTREVFLHGSLQEKYWAKGHFAFTLVHCLLSDKHMILCFFFLLFSLLLLTIKTICECTGICTSNFLGFLFFNQFGFHFPLSSFAVIIWQIGKVSIEQIGKKLIN